MSAETDLLPGLTGRWATLTMFSGNPSLHALSAAVTAVALAGAVWGAPAHAKVSKSKSQPAVVQPALPNKAEARLLEVIQLVERQNLDAALKAAGDLTAEVPHFRAAQLVYADLLRFKTGRMGGAAVAQASAGGLLVKHTLPVEMRQSGMPVELQEHLSGLQDELKRRVHAAGSLPAEGSVPSEFLTLGTSVRRAIAIDASKSRLYLFANEDGRLRLIGNFYVSVGKLGMGKTEEGDQRTPQGVYFIGRQIPGVKLPDFYGKGALTVNYPNDWDKAAGRSGGGIWLHGAPPDQFARIPEASDGCVVLANPDLTFLMRSVDLQTPVLIRDKLQWTAPKDLATQKVVAESFTQVLTDWTNAWKSADQRKLADLYAADFMQPTAKQPVQERLSAYFQGAGASLQDISVYGWKDAKGEIRIVNLKARSKAFAEGLPLRQYWRKTGNRWKLFSEEIMG